MVFHFSDQTVFVNSDDPAYLQKRGIIRSDKSVVIKSVGVDTQEFSMDKVDSQVLETLRQEINPEGKFLVLMVARAIWHKGVREFYDAAAAFEGKELLFVLAGGTDRGNPSSIDEEYLKSGLVLWLDQRDDIKELLALSDLFVLPSYREGVPRTLLEAASMQKAIITTDTVGCREVVDDGLNGFLIPTHSSEAIVQKVKQLIEDRKLLKQMGDLGREKMIREFDTRHVVAQYLDLYQGYENV